MRTMELAARLVKSGDARIRAVPVLTCNRALLRDLMPIANWRLQLDPT
jgi:hypothetical protein